MKRLIVIVMAILLSCMIAACGNAETDETGTEAMLSPELMEAQRTVNEMIHVEMPSEEKTEQGDSLDSGSKGLSTADMILARSHVQVLEVEEDEWKVRLTAPDMQAIAKKIRRDAGNMVLSEGEIEETLIAVENLTQEIERALRTGDYEMVESVLTLKVVNGEPVWDEEAVDALYGGLFSVYQSMLKEYEEVMDYEME